MSKNPVQRQFNIQREKSLGRALTLQRISYDPVSKMSFPSRHWQGRTLRYEVKPLHTPVSHECKIERSRRRTGPVPLIGVVLGQKPAIA